MHTERNWYRKKFECDIYVLRSSSSLIRSPPSASASVSMKIRAVICQEASNPSGRGWDRLGIDPSRGV